MKARVRGPLTQAGAEGGREVGKEEKGILHIAYNHVEGQ